jgi:hypothetical protein
MPQEEDVVDQLKAEMAKLFRGAAQVGEFLARRRSAALAAAEKASRRQARAQAEAMEEERRLAEPFYTRALDTAWWDTASAVEGAESYGHAKRFASLDPQAALAARTCEKEALERWGIDLTAVQTEETAPTRADAREAAPLLAGEDLSDADLDAALAQAQTRHTKEHGEADEALADSHGESTPQSRAEVEDDVRAEADWDSLEARKAWEDQMEGQVHDKDAVRAVVTADKGFHQPAAAATNAIAGNRTKVKRPRAARAASRTHARGM